MEIDIQTANIREGCPVQSCWDRQGSVRWKVQRPKRPRLLHMTELVAKHRTRGWVGPDVRRGYDVSGPRCSVHFICGSSDPLNDTSPRS